MLEAMIKGGKRICGFGAAAKGAVLLNYFGIDRSAIQCVYDDTPLKQGKYIPGVSIPILNPSEIEQDYPDVLMILPWNFADTIIQRTRGMFYGHYLIPIPNPRYL
jgi:hypothetical protein